MVIRLHDVSRRFGSRWVLTHISLNIAAAAAVLLTGDNGAGKTTLLRLMATVLTPTHGRIELFGQDCSIAAAAVRPQVGLMTHQHYLYEALSASENLQLLARLAGRSHVPWRVALEKVRLAAYVDTPVATFSAGMKRRLALARLLMLNPQLVLLDEPFGQLDPEGVALMENVIGAWRQAGKTLVLSTHDIERGKALCNCRMHLTGGRALSGLQPLEAG